MALEDLIRIRQARVLQPQPDAAHRQEYFVPFQNLIDGAHTESDITAALACKECVAVIGGSGSGKSSVIDYVITPAAGQPAAYLPIKLQLATETTADQLIQRDTFARYLARMVGKAAVTGGYLKWKEYEQLVQNTSNQVLPDKTVSRKFVAGASMGIFNANASRNIAQSFNTIGHQTTVAEIMEVLQTVLGNIAQDIAPVIVLDDTDRWLGSHSDTARMFFEQLPRFMADLSSDAGIVIAVHHEYCEYAEYQTACEHGYIRRECVVPTFNASLQLEQLLAHRLQSVSPSLACAEVFDSTALDYLQTAYLKLRDKGGLRTWLVQLDGALVLAIDSDHEQISRLNIEMGNAY